MITVKNLSKKYGDSEALKGITFSIKRGEIYGLLGPNGAGKTSIINILSTLVNKDGGEVSINGFNISKDSQKIQNSIGVVPQDFFFDPQLTGYENLLLKGKIYNLPSSVLEEKAVQALKLFGLFEKKDTVTNTYFIGMKRRLNFAAALLHSPEIIFLDEPTAGIDSENKKLIYEVIEKLNKQGVTFLCATHHLEEAEQLCNRIGIIDNGEIIAQGTLHELGSLPNIKQCINIHITNFKDQRIENEGLVSKFIIEELTEAPQGDFRFRNGILQYFSTKPKTDLKRLTDRLLKFGFNIATADITHPNLYSIFLGLTGKRL